MKNREKLLCYCWKIEKKKKHIVMVAKVIVFCLGVGGKGDFYG
jgi:hypothetical protein